MPAYLTDYVVAFIPIANAGYGEFSADKTIAAPKDMRFEFERKRFVIPSEFVVRDMTPPVPDIGRAWETNLVKVGDTIETWNAAFDRRKEEAGLEWPDSPTSYDSDETWMLYTDEKERVGNAMAGVRAGLAPAKLWAVEIWTDHGDDGHRDYCYDGIALVYAGMVEQAVKNMIGLHYAENAQVPWV